MSDDQPHILVFPYPAQGHMLALLDLSHHLARRGLALTILVTPNNLPIIAPLLSANPTIDTLLLPFPTYPGLPAGVENVKDLGNAGNIPIINAMAGLHDPIVRWFHSHPNPPSAIVSDFFLGWTLHLASQLGVPRIAFFSVRALLPPLLDCLWRMQRSPSGFPHQLSVLEFPDLPRSLILKRDHLPSLFLRCCRKSDPEAEFVAESMLTNRASWGCVFNTFDALEDDCLSHLRKEAGHGRVYGVGPLSPLPAAATHEKDSTGVAAWLDGCPDGSVVYVCFGSQKLLSGRQMEALASGLEKSGTRFLWVVKPGSGDGDGVVPEGFEERVGTRGLVIKGWASQVMILNHKAVGGFLSHCGWNSTLEAVVAGVRILAWPMEADQFVNARLLVEEIGVAVRVCEGADTVPDAGPLAVAIAEVMNREAPEKRRAEKLREEALAALRHGGSSAVDLDSLEQDLRGLAKPVAN